MWHNIYLHNNNNKVLFIFYMVLKLQQENPATTDYKSVRTITPWKHYKYIYTTTTYWTREFFTFSTDRHKKNAQNTAPLRNPRLYTAMVNRVTRMLPELWWPSNISEIGTAALGHKKRRFLTDGRPFQFWRAWNSMLQLPYVLVKITS